MLLLSIAATWLLQATPAPAIQSPPAPAPPVLEAVILSPHRDSLRFDRPSTRALVERTIRTSGTIPDGLEDYRATVRSAMGLSLAPDSTLGGDLPVTVDEFISEVRWGRPSTVYQRVRGHRIRMRAPAPYTLGTLLDEPWVVPHLYGPTIEVLALTGEDGARRRRTTRALHPFGPRGPLHYRYTAGKPLRIQLGGERVTLIPVAVRPLVPTGDDALQLVTGTFWIDPERAAVARARFGFTEPGRALRLGGTGVFLELENALWDGRFWLPFRQRREVQITSSLLGGAVAARIVNQFDDLELNTGWEPPAGRRSQLVRTQEDDPALFAQWEETIGTDAAELNIDDFADLRLAAGGARPDPGPLRIGVRYERADHFFRYNRVEGPYLGLGIGIRPEIPRAGVWDVYANGGWAFAEETARGELLAEWSPARTPTAASGPLWTLGGGVYRRLQDLRSFEPSLRWDLAYTLPALLGGSDLRDYYDAAGVELGARFGRGGWTGRLGGRYEHHDSVRIHTNRFIFGEADEFPALAFIEPGTHAAAEAEIGYARGAGAIGLGDGVVAVLRGEAGLAYFRFGRATALLSARRTFSLFTLATRLDAGHGRGDVPPQKLFRFGSDEGLRGYEDDEFGGSSAAVARGRLLIGLPPYGDEPLARAGVFILPPLRPALVLLSEAGWAAVDERSRSALARLGALPTDGVRGSIGVGVSVFNDFLTAEWIRPLDAERAGRWYIGLVQWF